MSTCKLPRPKYSFRETYNRNKWFNRMLQSFSPGGWGSPWSGGVLPGPGEEGVLLGPGGVLPGPGGVPFMSPFHLKLEQLLYMKILKYTNLSLALG